MRFRLNVSCCVVYHDIHCIKAIWFGAWRDYWYGGSVGICPGCHSPCDVLGWTQWNESMAVVMNAFLNQADFVY
ncbi:MAG: DUF3328 domain-containing protein [Xanthomonadaceae bacterium]|nr:DUF3328 domain-containing protein [Xanthomonadaceae bacterium]